jgi:hypothetical protein
MGMDGINPGNRTGTTGKAAPKVATAAEPAPTMARDGYVSRVRPEVAPKPKPSMLDTLAKVIAPVGLVAGLACVGLGLFGGMGLTMAVIGFASITSCMGLMMRG